MRIAHLSDLHLGHPDHSLRTQRKNLARLLDDALERGAEHFLFGGDLLDRANLEDASLLTRLLDERGLFHTDGFSVVPGNHDIWPISGSQVVSGTPKWLLGNLRALATRQDWPAQQQYEAFAQLFAPAFEGAECMYDSDPFPCVKRVGPTAIALLDSSADKGGLRSVAGRFQKKEGTWVEQTLRDTDARHSLLLIHHWPFPTQFEFGLPRFLEDTAAKLFESGFPNHRQVQNFVQRAGFDAVLCGHIHMFDDDPRSDSYEDTIGDIPVHCMGRSGGIDQGPSPTLAYHLIDAGPRTCRVSTRYLDT